MCASSPNQFKWVVYILNRQTYKCRIITYMNLAMVCAFFLLWVSFSNNIRETRASLLMIFAVAFNANRKKRKSKNFEDGRKKLREKSTIWSSIINILDVFLRMFCNSVESGKKYRIIRNQNNQYNTCRFVCAAHIFPSFNDCVVSSFYFSFLF